MKVTERQNISSKPEADWHLQVLGCPRCKGALLPIDEGLHCQNCDINYPVENEIPSLLTTELRGSLREGQVPVKGYYLLERYDWNKDPKGLEYIYHHYRRWETWRMINRFLKPGGKVLDIGCGTGLITQLLYRKHHTVIALDLNRWALAHINGKPFIRKSQADAELLPIQSESVDLIIATEVIEHLEAPERSASEMFRVCKPGGRVVGSVPSTNGIWKIRRQLSLSCPGNEPFHRNFTKRQITEFWRNAGFNVTVTSSCFGLNWLWVSEKP